jgi:hypothetical protein
MSAPSRRGLLGAVAALPLMAVPAAAAPSTGDDAELLRLGAEFLRNRVRFDELMRLHGDDVRMPAAVDAEVSESVRVSHNLAEDIAGLHASTFAGLRAKAHALLAYVAYTSDGDPSFANHDELLGWSIARDLCGDDAARPPPEDLV